MCDFTFLCLPSLIRCLAAGVDKSCFDSELDQEVLGPHPRMRHQAPNSVSGHSHITHTHTHAHTRTHAPAQTLSLSSRPKFSPVTSMVNCNLWATPINLSSGVTADATSVTSGHPFVLFELFQAPQTPFFFLGLTKTFPFQVCLPRNCAEDSWL